MAQAASQFRYRPLLRALGALPADQAQLRLSLHDLHHLLGPPTAPTDSALPNWTASRIAQTFRQRAGFSAKLDRIDRSITFTRQSLGSHPRQEA